MMVRKVNYTFSFDCSFELFLNLGSLIEDKVNGQNNLSPVNAPLTSLCQLVFRKDTVTTNKPLPWVVLYIPLPNLPRTSCKAHLSLFLAFL